MKISEAYLSRSKFNPKLERFDEQVTAIRKMVHLCRTQKGVFIPPAWIPEHVVHAASAKLGVPIGKV